MKVCGNCGNQIPDEAVVCTACGTAQNTTPEVVDNGGFLWGLLGCCVPVAGLILFIIWKDSKPKSAKAAGIGALVSVLLLVLYYVAIFILSFILGASGMYY